MSTIYSFRRLGKKFWQKKFLTLKIISVVILKLITHAKLKRILFIEIWQMYNEIECKQLGVI